MHDVAKVDDSALSHLVTRFYARVRTDDMLGPLFNQAVGDWPEHLERLAAFWSSVMLTSGRYKGQPVPAHMKHSALIKPAMFDRWLALWRATTSEVMSPAAAAALQGKALRIARSLSLALFTLDSQPAHGPAPAA